MQMAPGRRRLQTTMMTVISETGECSVLFCSPPSNWRPFETALAGRKVALLTNELDGRRRAADREQVARPQWAPSEKVCLAGQSKHKRPLRVGSLAPLLVASRRGSLLIAGRKTKQNKAQQTKVPPACGGSFELTLSSAHRVHQTSCGRTWDSLGTNSIFSQERLIDTHKQPNIQRN